MAVPSAAEGRFYVACAAGATTPLQQKAAAMGDDVDHIWIEAGAGTVAIKDGGVTVFTWDAQTVERFVPLAWKSRASGGWSVTTVGVAAVATGAFS